MIEKILRRFCSDEVKLLLNRLEEHPEEFKTHFSGRDSKWVWLMEQVESTGTRIEQLVVSKVREKTFKKLRRQTLLGEIVAQSIAPEEVTREQIEDGQFSRSHAAHIQLQKQYSMMQAQALGGGGGGGLMQAQGIGAPSQLMAAQQLRPAQSPYQQTK